jgi:hypothetical protein
MYYLNNILYTIYKLYNLYSNNILYNKLYYIIIIYTNLLLNVPKIFT